jgi:hypothetical protein
MYWLAEQFDTMFDMGIRTSSKRLAGFYIIVAMMMDTFHRLHPNGHIPPSVRSMKIVLPLGVK